jgi:hypothetical protein
MKKYWCYSLFTFQPICRKSIIKIKCVSYKKKLNLKIMKRGMKKKVQFHLHVFKKCQTLSERWFFRSVVTVEAVTPGPQKIFWRPHAAHEPHVLQARCTSARLHSAISQKAVIFILAVVRTWNVTRYPTSCKCFCVIDSILHTTFIAKWCICVSWFNTCCVSMLYVFK